MSVVTANAASASGAVFPHVWLAAAGCYATGLAAGGWWPFRTGLPGWTMVAM